MVVSKFLNSESLFNKLVNLSIFLPDIIEKFYQINSGLVRYNSG